MSKKLPKTIYGFWQNDTGTKGDEFLNTSPDANTLVEEGKTLIVGVYELKGTAEVKNSTEVKPLK